MTPVRQAWLTSFVVRSVFYPYRSDIGTRDACALDGPRTHDCVILQGSQFYPRKSFLAVMLFSDTNGGKNELPWNLPEVLRPFDGDPYIYDRYLASGLLIGFSTNERIGDPTLDPNARTGRALHSRMLTSPAALEPPAPKWQQETDYYDDFETYARFLQAGGDENATCGGATFPDACFFKGLGCRPTPDSVVLDTMGLRRADYTWMSTIGGPNEAFGHIALPYLPFFSNCEGHDSFVHIGKLLGKCTRASVMLEL